MITNGKKLVVVALLICAAVFVGVPGEAKDKDGNLQFVIIAKYVHPWFDDGAAGFDYAAEEIGGITTRYVSPKGASGEEQAKLMEDIMAEKPDGIAIAVNTPEALKPVIDEASRLGIPVVTWDDTSWDSEQLMFFGTDNYAAGVLEGEQFVQLSGGKGNYIILCHETVSTNTKERLRGIHDVVDKHPDIKQLIDEQPTGTNMGTTLPVVENLLAAYGDTATAFLDINLPGTTALHQTLKERRADPGKYTMLTWTLLPEIVNAIEDGYVTLSLRQNPYAMGYLAGYGLKFATEGLKPTTNFFPTGITIATKDNLSVVEEENKKKAHTMVEEMKKLWK